MRLRLGRRKFLALAGFTLVALAALAAWWFWDATGLLVVLLVSSVGSTLALGWFTAQSERRTRRLLTELQGTQVARDKSQQDGLNRLSDRLDDLHGQFTPPPGRQAEQLLTAINARLTRTEMTHEQLSASLRQDFEQASGRIVEAVQSSAENLDRSAVRSSERESKHVSTESKRLFRQIEALVALYIEVRPDVSFPPSRGWAASPDLLVYLYRTVRARKPRLVLECGSGLSTLVMAHALKANGAGTVVALEHLEEYRDLTAQWGMSHGIDEWMDIRLAPLVLFTLDGEEWPWYSTESLSDEKIDLLFVDGPPGDTRAHARYPALPLLAEQLSPEGIVILDDASRSGGATIAEKWAAQFPEWVMTVVGHEKGTATFTREERSESIASEGQGARS